MIYVINVFIFKLYVRKAWHISPVTKALIIYINANNMDKY